ncbi:hypothetical protein G6F32_017349 [Rhizopus arrhizus]|nr:hypothetical protein G6F32_017349 [Rhizopus arrhizus]
MLARNDMAPLGAFQSLSRACRARAQAAGATDKRPRAADGRCCRPTRRRCRGEAGRGHADGVNGGGLREGPGQPAAR